MVMDDNKGVRLKVRASSGFVVDFKEQMIYIRSWVE